MHDLVIRNGRIVDGTGAPAFVGDVAIDGGKISIVGTVNGTGVREIDAKGLLVTPGWVDMHTHYDGQVTWDPFFTPSGWHGVTTVVMGDSVGVGFAPVRRDDRDWLINVMEGVEDIPGSALHEGIQWDWETFPEYMDALEKLPHAIDYGTQVPHSAVRAWVMGRKGGEDDAATPEQISEMSAIVEEALNAGALGFSTSRTILHKSAEGVCVPGTYASEDELFGIGDALRRAGSGVFEAAVEHTEVPIEFDWMSRMTDHTGQPLIFNLSQTDFAPSLYRDVLDKIAAARKQGKPIFGQCAGRAIGILMTWQGTAHPFALHPSFMAVADKPWLELLELLKTPEFKATLLAEKPVEVGVFETFITQTFSKMFRMAQADYEPTADDSVASVAKATGQDPLELAYEWLMQNDGTGFMYFPLFNYSGGDLDVLHEMHTHEGTLMGLSDGGAHCGAICDAGMPTFMLTHWARDRSRGAKIPLETIVKRQTSQTAAIYGLHDRGVLAEGYIADVNIIDYEALSLGAPKMVHDLPAGGKRLVQRASGYRYTIKSGVPIVVDGELMDARPGRLLRGVQDAPTRFVSASTQDTRPSA